MELDEEALEQQVRNGQLGEVLQVLPRERWAEQKWVQLALQCVANAPALRYLLEAGAPHTFRILEREYLILDHWEEPFVEVACEYAQPGALREKLRYTAKRSTGYPHIFIKHGARIASSIDCRDYD